MYECLLVLAMLLIELGNALFQLCLESVDKVLTSKLLSALQPLDSILPSPLRNEK